jgi:hypothetical protein
MSAYEDLSDFGNPYIFSADIKYKLLKQFMVDRFPLTPRLIRGLTEVDTKANRFNGFKEVAKHIRFWKPDRSGANVLTLSNK